MKLTTVWASKASGFNLFFSVIFFFHMEYYVCEMRCIFLNIRKLRHVRFVESSNILLCCYIWFFFPVVLGNWYHIRMHDARENVWKIRLPLTHSHWISSIGRLTENVKDFFFALNISYDAIHTRAHTFDCSVHISVSPLFGFWHDRWCATIVIQHLSNHYPIANGIYIGHFGDNTKSEWARWARVREREPNVYTHTHLLPCIHVRPILLSVYLLFAWSCYAFFSISFSPLFIICSVVMCAPVRSLTTIPVHESWYVLFLSLPAFVFNSLSVSSTLNKWLGVDYAVQFSS